MKNRRGESMRDDIKTPDYYLENMPLAYCTVKVVKDKNGKASDLEIIYSNKAHRKMEGVQSDTLTGKRISQMFKEEYRKWMPYFADTASSGTAHTISHYMSRMDRHFLLCMYQLEEGICGCVFQDITPGYGSRDKTMQDHEKLDFLLGTTTDLVFEYNSRTDMLTLVGGGYSRGDRRMITGFPQGLFEEGILRRKDEARLRTEVDKLDGRRQNIQFDIQACLSGDGTYRWYTVNCSEYAERFTGYRCVVGWIKDIEQQRQNRKMLEKDAMYDSLTDIYNMKTGKDLVEEWIRQKKPSSSHIMFLMDLDNFKNVNDTYGHHRGDEVLQQFARIVKGVFRENDIVYRMGGDEFIGFTKNVSMPEQAVERIMKSLYQKMEKESGLGVSCSVGVFVTDRACSYQHLYRMADQALYEAKRAGKNRYQIIREYEQPEETSP